MTRATYVDGVQIAGDERLIAPSHEEVLEGFCRATMTAFNGIERTLALMGYAEKDSKMLDMIVDNFIFFMNDYIDIKKALK